MLIIIRDQHLVVRACEQIECATAAAATLFASQPASKAATVVEVELESELAATERTAKEKTPQRRAANFSANQ